MWSVHGQETDWPKLESLEPERVLDFYDGPRLFTVQTTDGFQLLVYQCDADADTARFILVPTRDELLAKITGNLITLREALTSQNLAWLIEQRGDGTLSRPCVIDLRKLPDDALPGEGARLFVDTDVLLRVRMIGRGIEVGHVPASVVKRTVDGVTDAIKTLVRQVVGVSGEVYRRYYDLPARHFAFQSFEIAFGKPNDPAELLDADMFERIRPLLAKGLAWAELGNGDVPSTPEWPAIVNALAKLAPPQRGIIQEVEVSGVLAGLEHRMVRLTRNTTRRIVEARKLLNPDVLLHTDIGYVREFDKDKLTFLLRNAKAEDIRSVEFAEEQYDHVWVAFDTDRIVTIVSTETADAAHAELVSITFGASAGEDAGGAEREPE
jgi:hypothetical protein